MSNLLLKMLVESTNLQQHCDQASKAAIRVVNNFRRFLSSFRQFLCGNCAKPLTFFSNQTNSCSTLMDPREAKLPDPSRALLNGAESVVVAGRRHSLDWTVHYHAEGGTWESS